MRNLIHRCFFFWAKSTDFGAPDVQQKNMSQHGGSTWAQPSSRHRSREHRWSRRGNTPSPATPRGKALKVSLCEFIYWLVVSTPLKKYESQLGWLFPIHGKIKKMFQTTNQIYILIIYYIDYIDISIFYYILIYFNIC